MSEEVRVANFKHTTFERNGPAITELLTAMTPYVVAAAVAPNFHVETPRVQQTLARAFDVSKLLNNKACAAHHATKLSGFAIALDGQMPLDSIERIDIFGAWNFGLGTSVYQLENSESLGDKSDATLRQLNDRAKDSLAHLLTPNQRIAVARTLTQFDGERLMLFVTANDVVAARRLYRYLAARAGKNEALLLTTLASSDEYSALIEQSQCARDTLAVAYAKALGLKLAGTEKGPKAVLTSWHYAIVESNPLAHGRLTTKVPQPTGHTPKFYVVYNNATPTYTNNGGVVVSHGIMGGFTVLHTDDDKGWYQPQYLSLLPATTLARNEETKMLAQHRKSNERTEAAFDARIVWIGDLGDAFMHLKADEAFESMEDPFSMRWIEKLSPAGDAALQQQRYQTVTGQLSSTTTVYATLQELAQLARDPKTPLGVAVALDHPIVHRIIALWDAHIKPSGYKPELAEVFANQYTSDENDGFRLLSRHTVCRNADHAHSANAGTLYKDASKYLQPDFKAEKRSLIMMASATDYNDVDHLRSLFVVNETVEADFQARTIVTLDKDLVRIVTLDEEAAEQE